jgi:adenylate cyclase
MLTRLSKALPLGALVALAGLAFGNLRFVADLEKDVGLGLLFQLRGPQRPPADAVVVSIDKDSADQLSIPENPDKWPRSLHARLVEVLSKAGAAVIAFDVHFVESRVPADDESFAAAIRKAGNVVLGDPMVAREIPVGESDAEEHSIVRIVKPLPLLAESAVATAPFVLPRIPFKVNQYWAFQTEAALSPPPTLPVVAYQLFGRASFGDFVRLLESVRPALAGKLPPSLEAPIASKSVTTVMSNVKQLFDGDPTLADDMKRQLEQSTSAPSDGNRGPMLRSLIELYGGPGRRYVNYYGPPRTVTTIPYYRALQSSEPGANSALDVRGKAVFVGLSERILAERKDSFYTVFSQANGVFIAGVEIGATAFLNLLEDGAVKPLGDRAYLALIATWGFLLGVVCRMSSLAVGAVIVSVLSVGYSLGAHASFSGTGSWYPILVPLVLQAPLAFIGAAAWSYFETQKERQHLRKALAYYVPNDIVEQLATNIVSLKHGGQEYYGSCLFADVAGYTTFSEKMTPQQVSDLMHRYFEATFAPVKKYGGLVVDMKGDSFLAIWKAAKPNDDLRRRACLAAYEVVLAVRRLNEGANGGLKLHTRVGLHSGPIYVGNIGAGDRYVYGPTGDTVNTASRMDGLNKYLGTDVLVSEESVANVDGLVAREVGKFTFKGKEQPLVVYEVLGRTAEATDTQKQSCAVFAEALSAFRRQEWDDAAAKFSQATVVCEDDGPARYYLQLCEDYKKKSPGDPWDGVIILQEK